MRAVLRGAVAVAAAELQPRVAEPLGMRVLAAEQQVPLHPLLRVGVRLDPVRGQVAVQQERQRQREHLRLAGAVVAAQQQPAVAEPELLLVVVEEVDQPGAQRLPALGRSGLGEVVSGSPRWSADGRFGHARSGRARAARDHDRRYAVARVAAPRSRSSAMVEQLRLGARLGRVASPVRLVLAGRRRTQRDQVARPAPSSARRARYSATSSVTWPSVPLLGHPHVGQLVVRVDHRDALGPHLGDQAGRSADPPGDRGRCPTR